MRKISELLVICKKHHELWGGSKIGMCFSAKEARRYGEITSEECARVRTYSMNLVEAIDPLESYLFEALGLDRTHKRDRLKLENWWEDHINSLKEEGL